MATVSTQPTNWTETDEYRLYDVFPIYEDGTTHCVGFVTADQQPRPNKVVYWHVLSRDGLGILYQAMTLKDARAWAERSL